MPYHNDVSSTKTPLATNLRYDVNYTALDDNGVPIPSEGSLSGYPQHGYVREGVPYISCVRRRTGTNANHASLDDPHFKSVPTVKLKKRKIGERIVFKSRYVKVKDRKTGKLVSDIRHIEYRQAIFVTVPEIIYRKVKIKVKPDSLLAPNALNFEESVKSLIPSTSTVTASRLMETFNGIPGSQVNVEFILDDFMQHTCSIPGLTVALFGHDWHTDIFSSIPPSVSDIEERALRKLYKKVSSEFPDYLVSVGELGSSYKTLKDILQVSISLAKDIKRLDLASLSAKFKGLGPENLSKLWLTYIYGLKPIVQDISDSINLITRDSRTWRTYSSSETDDILINNLSEPYPPNYTGNDFSYGVKTTKRKYKHTVRFGVVMKGNQSMDRFVSQQKPIEKQLSTIYELIPYSFMVDWVYDLGSMLASRNIFDNDLIHAWKTVYIIDDNQQELVLNSSFNLLTGCKFSGPKFFFSGVRVLCIRDILSSMPGMPSPKFKLWEEGLNMSQRINTLAVYLARKK